MKIPSTVRDPKILAQRRAELVEVATTLFLERGYHKTSIRDIARACPFNLAALYMYVGSKEDILYLVAQHLVNEIVKELKPATLTDRDPAEALRFAFQTYCRVVHRFSRHIRLLYREIESLPRPARDPILTSVESLVVIFEELLDRAVACGEVRKIDTRLIAVNFIVAAHMWALHGRLLRSQMNLDKFVEEQSAALFDGVLANVPGRRVAPIDGKRAAAPAPATRRGTGGNIAKRAARTKT